MSSAAAQDVTGDAQRLMCAIAGGVPPDVVYFDRFAIGEWAARDALTRPHADARAAESGRSISHRPLAVLRLGDRRGELQPAGIERAAGIYGVP
jgi:hypothetical protein